MPWDLQKLWLGHANKDVTDRYAEQLKEDVEWRKQEAERAGLFRLTKGAVKLHLLLDHNGYLPSFAVISEGKKHEVRVARQMQFAPGATLVFDRGYTDNEWFMSLTEQRVYFVTRSKENADYGVVEKREVPQRRGVLRDEVVFFYFEKQRKGDLLLLVRGMA